jgi:hypothetical protein
VIEQSSAVEDVSVVWILNEGTPVVTGAIDPREETTGTTGAKNMNPPIARRSTQRIEALFTFLRNIRSESAFEHPEQSPHRHPVSHMEQPHLAGVFWKIIRGSPGFRGPVAPASE